MLYGRELDTVFDLITQLSSEGVNDPGIPYPETLRASLQEAHDLAKAALDHSQDRQKHYYDLRRHQTKFSVELSRTPDLSLSLTLLLNLLHCMKDH